MNNDENKDISIEEAMNDLAHFVRNIGSILALPRSTARTRALQQTRDKIKEAVASLEIAVENEENNHERH